MYPLQKMFALEIWFYILEMLDALEVSYTYGESKQV